MIVFLVVSTLIQIFDVYLDLRQRSMYKIEQLPTSFTDGFNLSDAVDKELKLGPYAEVKKELEDANVTPPLSKVGHERDPSLDVSVPK